MTAISGTVSSFRSMADGSIRIVCDFSEQESRKAKDLLCDVGATVAIARLQDGQGEAQIDQPSTSAAQNTKALYGQQARALRLSGFFMQLAVWKAVGTDAEFLIWVRQQKCCVCGAQAPSEAAHVRRIANGAGTGIKPPYSAVSMCHECHAKQHAAGESAIGGEAFMDEQRVYALQCWCWSKLKADLGYAHWSEVPLQVLSDWADQNGVNTYLPAKYKA